MIASTEESFWWFKDNEDMISDGHVGESVIISDCKILGYYPNDEAAWHAAESLERDTYLIQQCVPKEERGHIVRIGSVKY